MVEAGDSADHAQAMYDESVTTVVLAAVVVAAIASIVLAVVLARMLARPLAEVGGAARRIADGDYAARVPREGPEEIASLADSFNQMAASLERQEAMRRDFIANAAHELRTPLTNLQGYLEALRDGVIDAGPGDLRLALGRGRAARPAVALARCAGRGRRRDQRRPGSRSSTSRRPSGPPSSSPSRRSSAPASRLVVDVPERLPARANPDHLAQVLGQPPVERGALHAGRRHGHRPRRAPRRRTSWSRSRTPATASRPTTSSASSSASTASRSRATGRAAAPGIGLAIVKQLVEAGGGRVGAESRDGQTRFWFSLPA